MKLIFLFFVLLNCGAALADPMPASWDEDRRAGFNEHRKGEQIFDREREKGRTGFLEEIEKWERQRRAAIQEHKKTRQVDAPREGGPEDRADQRKRRVMVEESEQAKSEYVRRKKIAAQRSTHQRNHLSEEKELGLDQERPRFDVSKRQLFGVPGKSSPSGGSSYGGGGSSSSGSTPSFPPPPSYSENGEGDAYIPPPPGIPEFEDMPAPPPIGVPFDGVPGDSFPPPPPDFGEFPPMPPMPEGF